MTEQTVTSPKPAAPDAPEDPKARKPFRAGIAVGVLVVIALVGMGLWSGISKLAENADTAKKLSEIRSIVDVYHVTHPDNAKLFADPRVTDFRQDQVFSSPEWRAYEKLSSEEIRDQRYANLRHAIDVSATLTQKSAKAAAQRDIDFYQQYLDAGAPDGGVVEAAQADAVRLTQQACKAAEAGKSPASFIAEWKVGTSDPKPSVHLAPNADKAAADAIIQKAYVAAMTAGVKHLCP
jgi:hypothetical protein